MASTRTRRPLTHDQILRARAGVTLRATVDRIVRTFDRATPADIAAGASWYGADSTAVLAGMVAAGAPSLEHAAAIVGQLSPRTTWGRNVSGAVAMATTFGLTGDATDAAAAARAVGCMGDNVDRARVALESSDPLATMNGPKVSRFARNLLGDREAVTVDVWAARVAFGPRHADPEHALSLVGVYGATEHAYRLAAARRGVDPTTMQATTWIVARGGRAS